MGGFSGLTIGMRALQAMQLAMETTGHNIANANTPGYSRQRVELVESLPDITPWGNRGTGVEVARIARVREEYLNVQLRNETKLLGQWEEIDKFLSRLELYFNEPSDEGFNQMLSKFWSRWEDLSLTPEEQTTRSNLYQQADVLATALNTLAQKIESLRSEADTAAKSYVQEINTLAMNIASLNEQIRFYEVGDAVANDLRDQRDELLRQLSELIEFSSEEQPDGTIIVSIGGHNLVDKVFYEQISYVYNSDGHILPIWETNHELVAVRAGKLRGVIDVRDANIPVYMNRIDEIATTLIKQVNRLHTQGWSLSSFSRVVSSYTVSDSSEEISSEDSGLDFYDEISDGSFVITVVDDDGNTVSENTVNITTGLGGTTTDDIISTIGSDYTSGISHLKAYVDADGHLIIEAESGYGFFANQDTSGALLAYGINTFFSGTDASTISVNSTIASNVKFISAARENLPGDGRNALAIAQLKDSQVMDNGSATIYDYYASTLGMLGVEKSESEGMKKGQEVLITHVKNGIEEVSGVSLDEEAMNLLRFQKTYALAARYLGTVSDMLDSLINEVAR